MGKKRELVVLYVYLMSCDYCVVRPHDATDLSAVCHCRTSSLYPLTILVVLSMKKVL